MFHFLLSVMIPLHSYAFILRGQATSIDGKQLLYTEMHTITTDGKGLNKKIETKYYKPDGKLFAEMDSNFSWNPTLPEIKFRDSRFEKFQEMSVDAMSDTITFKSQLGKKPATFKKIKLKANMAAGQGFDNFIKINFESLLNSSIPLHFGVLSELDFFSFNAYKKSQTRDKVQFGIDISSFFLRLFSTELILEYNVQSKQILSYQGLSNLFNDNGKPQNVLIRYTSDSDEAKP